MALGQQIRSDKTVTLACRINVADAARFQTIAERRGQTVNEMLGALIRRRIDRKEDR